ncbi:restriction endonuclease subunit S [Shewanella algae]|uniref:restriction endonuclease subunit S n=1 Tax=Shewanella algae TaxID=38313 RepID=UPI001AAD329E|nr:restriction endonuclease subunit S [Shewanella algae]MBO2552305.1 restriction endonuclease subunit S [Shewanella algae]
MSFEIIEANLGDFLDFKNGKTSPERSEDGDIRVFGSNGFIGFSNEHNSDENTLIIGRVGTYCGSVHFSHEKCWVTDNAIACKPRVDQEAPFWYHTLKMLDLNQFRSGSGQPLLNQSILNSVGCKVPKFSAERVRIGNALHQLELKITLNTQTNQTLEQMAQALFKSWFVDFDPVIDNALDSGFFEREFAGEGIPEPLAKRVAIRQALREAAAADTDASAIGRLPPETRALFPDSFEEHPELGWIPEGWECVEVKELCKKVQNGGTPKRNEPIFWEGGDIPWLTSGEVRQGLIVAVDKTITEKGLQSSSAKWLPADVTLIALYGATAGEVAFSSIPLTTNQAVCALIPDLHVRFFNYLAMKSKVAELAGLAVGSAQQNISKGLVESTQVIRPSDSVLEKFDVTLQPIFSRWQANIKQAQSLAKLRDTLLPKLLSGELTVFDVCQENQVESKVA